MSRKSAVFTRILLFTFIVIVAAGCREKNDWEINEGVVWHTTYRIVYNSDRNLADSVNAVFTEVEQSLSPFRDNSLISRINRSETAETDSLIRRAFEIARRVNTASGGRLDPTVAPLVNIWGFGTDSVARKLAEDTDPSHPFIVPQETIDSALSLVGIADCRIENGLISKKHPLTTFNFSAITKGMGCDMVAAMLRRNGVKNYMVEIGGEIAASGHNARMRPWQIQLDSPAEENGAPQHEALKIISLTDGGVATSGNYRNFHKTAGYGKIGHTINPADGRPARSEILSATVLAPTCGEADAWATACMTQPTAADALRMLATDPSVEALLVVAAGDSLQTVSIPDCRFK